MVASKILEREVTAVTLRLAGRNLPVRDSTFTLCVQGRIYHLLLRLLGVIGSKKLLSTHM